jgi:hypothetical protein
VLTPFVNASVEGTEFLVAMRCESALVPFKVTHRSN